MFIYWLFLALAIVTEVIGTLSMKYASINGNTTGYIVMYVMISCSYILLAFSVKRVALGIAYALWEGIGLLIITTFSVGLFDEPLSSMKLLGLGVLLLGIVLLKSGADENDENKETVSKPQKISLEQGA